MNITTTQMFKVYSSQTVQLNFGMSTFRLNVRTIKFSLYEIILT